MTILVHHLNNSRSQRILWLLEELGEPYEVRRYERDRKTMRAPESLRAIHPLGRSPVVEVDGHRLIETGAIMEHLVARAGNRFGPPADADGAIRYRQYMHYAEGSMMPPLLALLIIGKLGLFGRPARPTVQRMLDDHLDWLETELASRPYFAGDAFTAADMMMSFPLEASRARGGLDSSRPHLIRWLEDMQARPAYTAALAAGGPYAYA
ncbi:MULTISPECIES: glutathione S-transferase family protein [Sphingobium]|uniref:glutathione transferase n=1 Tax=Sphingobium cupriresistens TaxID=1132417 RepID=A0A8G1ZML2_9SPHN|nr:MULTISPECIES: glutathione S-transferase [Sphingobium]MBJ7377619.1 glutathione S-transferase [Sphingobium sp.]MBJ7445840.1 glutathione S-transferase [Sphingobium sp.]RYM11681.1 glutathione S-transferase [Sphingobium cupriresistens]